MEGSVRFTHDQLFCQYVISTSLYTTDGSDREGDGGIVFFREILSSRKVSWDLAVRGLVQLAC